MMDFVYAALPWVAIAVSIAIIAANLAKRSKRKKAPGNTDTHDNHTLDTDKKHTEGDYISYGISIGMCIGVAIGSALTGIYGSIALSYGICFGMLGGVVVGSFIKKK
ncbi:MAG: hypothetical protein FWH57_11010 [Oscillospiraceae bacterium]|nr:hypothetical protein [Oscillospiraceae bacterium]